MKRAAPACPRCGKASSIAADNPWRPFCSERCKMADLGQWFTEKYSIPADPDPDLPPDQPDPKPRQ